MAECNGCGRVISDEYEYCPHCGTRRGDFLLMKYNSLSQKEAKRKKRFKISLFNHSGYSLNYFNCSIYK